MLKEIEFKNTKIHVPIPILNLQEAIGWAEKSILSPNELITKIILDGQSIDIENSFQLNRISLKPSSKLKIQIDSPKELTLFATEAIRDLSYEIDRRLGTLAVNFWIEPSQEDLNKVAQTKTDIEMMLQLIEQINGILDPSLPEMAGVNALKGLITRVLIKLERAIKEKDWKQCALILIHEAGYWLHEMVIESEKLEIQLLTLLN